MKKVMYGAGVILCSALCLFTSCGSDDSSEQSAAPQKHAGSQMKNEVVTLFDGTDFNAWNMDKQGGWVIDGGTMSLGDGGSIWTKERFGDFELDLDFKVSLECNSGIFIRTGSLTDPVQTGIEIQVLDSAGKANPDKHDSGALYDLLEPSSNPMKPADEWNHVIITCDDNIITVVMNGATIIDTDVDRWSTPQKNPDGTDNKFKTALKDFPREGYIGFQDHGHPVWYRNVTLKKINR